MTKPRKHAELIKAWADGKDIEFFNPTHGCWVYSRNPVWDDATLYRVKPESEIHKKYSIEEILNLPMEENDAEAKTIGEYLKILFLTLWEKKEEFSGKRPFGNSSWEYDVIDSLARANLIEHEVNEWGNIDFPDTSEGNRIIKECIDYVFNKGSKTQ